MILNFQSSKLKFENWKSKNEILKLGNWMMQSFTVTCLESNIWSIFLLCIGLVLFLEEDHYVAEDFLHVLKMVNQERITNRKDNEDIICLGTYLKNLNFPRNSKIVSTKKPNCQQIYWYQKGTVKRLIFFQSHIKHRFSRIRRHVFHY